MKSETRQSLTDFIYGNDNEETIVKNWHPWYEIQRQNCKRSNGILLYPGMFWKDQIAAVGRKMLYHELVSISLGYFFSDPKHITIQSVVTSLTFLFPLHRGCTLVLLRNLS